MTYEEAIARLKICETECGDCLTCKEHDDAISLAIEVLEKQVPKKVVREHKKFQRWFNDTYHCPTCGESAYTESGDQYVDYGLDWCNHCGQALLWEDDE